MLQRRPRPRPGHALKKLASPRPCTFQSVDGGRRVCGGSLRPNRRTPPRKGRAPKPSARDAPSAVCDPIDTHSSQSAQPQTEGAPAPLRGTVSTDAGFGRGRGFVLGGRRSRHVPFNRHQRGSSPPPAGASLRRPPHTKEKRGEVARDGAQSGEISRQCLFYLPLVGRSAGPWGCRVGGRGDGGRRAGGCSTTPPRCRWFPDVTRLGGHPRGRRGWPWGRWGGGRSPWCLRAGRFQATPSRHAVRRSCAPG